MLLSLHQQYENNEIFVLAEDVQLDDVMVCAVHNMHF